MTTLSTVHKSDERRYDVVTSGVLFPRPPFHFDGTFKKPSHLPSTLYIWTPGVFYQSIRIAERLIGLKLSASTRGGRQAILVEMFYHRPLGSDEAGAILQELRFRYALDEDLGPFRRLVYAQKFAPVAVFRRWMGMRASSPYSLYELLVVGLVLQNTQARRSVQMLAALLTAFGTRLSFGGVEIDALWSPRRLERVTEARLRGLRIGYRAKALKRFSAQFAKNMIDEKALRQMDDLGLRSALLEIYGVGPETARILRSEAFHRPQAFDHLAPWQLKVYSRLFYNKERVAATRVLKDVRRVFGAHTALAVHYLWEDLFWRHQRAAIPWLAAEIRL
jgi:3-methyladenine DNA glycosylase/8-oxoguanine DNA glycosylase